MAGVDEHDVLPIASQDAYCDCTAPHGTGATVHAQFTSISNHDLRLQDLTDIAKSHTST